jgi:asparagine synthase (glutamine-hydrolysing)
MFVLVAAQQGQVGLHEITAMAMSLRGGQRAAGIWCDTEGRAAAAGSVFGALAQDEFCRQPFVSNDLTFVGQARIDNREEVLSKLAIARLHWRTTSDCDVLHLAYRRWREGCVNELSGDYAFAAWHPDTGRAVASIGHSNSVRLYYLVCGGKLLVSPQLGALLAHPTLVARELNLPALGQMIAPLIEPGSTPYANIRSLVCGHQLIWDRGTLILRRWWQPDTTVRIRYRDSRDYVCHAKEIFDRAVRDCLRSVGGIAATLSGGLDSTLVSATAACELKRHGRSITAYTSVPEPDLPCAHRHGWESDDSPYARAVVAGHDNMRHVAVTPGGLCPLDILPAIHEGSCTPVRNQANHLWMGHISRMAAQSGARVLLTGAMGNATISASGEGAVRGLLGQIRLRAALDLAASYIEDGAGAGWRRLVADLLGPHAAALMRRLLGRGALLQRPGARFFSPAFRAARGELPHLPRVGGRRGALRFALFPRGAFWAADPIPQWGIEWRDPTADRRLMECLLSFPLEAFVVDGHNRGLARAMGEGLVPDIVRFRRTQGAQVPETAAIIAKHAPRYRAALEQLAATTDFAALVDIDRLRSSLERLCAGDQDLVLALTVDRAMDVGMFIAAADAWRSRRRESP